MPKMMITQHLEQAVVLLHGLGANRFAMLRLAMSLKANGYAVANWGYPSTRSSIELQSRSFGNRLKEFVGSRPFSAVHLVTHSMGGIIARRAIGVDRPANLGRMVMLSPPNSGSHIARRLATPLGWLCPPLAELSDAPDSYVNRLAEPFDVELGVIAAAYDRLVSLPSTRLTCQSDHIVLPSLHGTLPWRRDAVAQVLHFLQHGKFYRDTLPETTQRCGESDAVSS